MSMESARAFVVRLMSDEEFRGKLAKVASVAEIETLVAEYSFSKEELEKIVGEFMGHKLAEGELEKLVGEFMGHKLADGELEKLIGEAFEGQETGPETIAVITAWVSQK